jgi:cytochrome c-type biogenesis protein CcmE
MIRPKFLVAGGLILGSLVFLMYNGINDAMVRYHEVPEVLAHPAAFTGSGIRLKGQVKPGTVHLYKRQSKVDFEIYDQASKLSLPVTYEGDIPDTFQERAEVVIEGRYHEDDKQFWATMLLAKCPSKYESDEELEAVVASSAPPLMSEP